MTNEQIESLLSMVSRGESSVDEAMDALRDLPYEDLGHTKIDHHRALRNGFPEVIYGAGKTPEQVAEIFGAMMTRSHVLATRVTEAMATAVRAVCPDVEYNRLGRTLVYRRTPIEYRGGKVMIVTAGTSDLPIAEEARVTADILGNPTELISDVGVAGIHRLFGSIDQIRDAAIIIVVAGMEGALASVVGGMVDRPIIAVPTSVGYGASFEGIAALLGMLTSCASGISVVNIDNGFGAACAANRINRLTTAELG
jgi:pyridinium-3,5-biscarboxylic acid mononucleotide synthase